MVVLTGVADIIYYVLMVVLAIEMCKGKVLNIFKILQLAQLNYFTKRKKRVVVSSQCGFPGVN